MVILVTRDRKIYKRYMNVYVDFINFHIKYQYFSTKDTKRDEENGELCTEIFQCIYVNLGGVST